MQTTINDRISALLGAVGKNPSSFARSIDKAYTSIESITKGKTKPSFDLLEAILKTYPQVNTDWLMNGTGELFRKDGLNDQENKTDGYLYEHLKLLEENFTRLSTQLESKDRQIASLEDSQKSLQRMLEIVLGKSRGAAFTQLSEEEAFELTMGLYKQVGMGKAPNSPVSQPRRFDMPTPARPAALR